MKENINQNLNSKQDLTKKLKKWLKFIVLGAVVVFLLSLVFNKFFWDSIVMNIRTKLFLYNIEKQEQRYKEDKFGGKTPEETYEMFLDALRKKDIELASKYFVLDKQDEYKKVLNGIDGNDNWELMIKDLTNNKKFEKLGNTMYVLNVYNIKNEQVAQITMILPTATFDIKDPISEVWKISSF